ncbi:BlaR1 family beta-lactam sensor/signal transducer [Gracilibacillus sp. S3-1-1]|uniref:BlaR1 family beta-lactam sensor/signal transducer n=1 Tax=Gracilibacillus pellucidus TaxID=3095368 RepID=A0ACC6M6M9_9BACI|nr:BlaR1 family beta-lactam sensor/signal transducer [Gracilibacillus sp. S3-1-1]MDX8046477.1 BlaR1 family beta-lactam sensor/signal transducer [Gracilibacillus sp. S3-1-1]
MNNVSFDNTSNISQGNQNWMQDFAVSVNRFDQDYINIILAGIWIAGMIVMITIALRAWFQLKKIKDTAWIPPNPNVIRILEECKQHLNISKPILVRQSPLVRSPMIFGLFKTYIVIPIHIDEWLSEDYLTYIFMHELHHFKQKDIVTNYLTVIFQIIYWFNPLVWIAFREMRVDREVACDIGVLKCLDKHSYTDYGNAIIDLAALFSRSKRFSFTNQFNESKRQIKKRMEKIISFADESKWLKIKSMIIFSLICVVVACQTSFISLADSGTNSYSFDNDQAYYEDLSDYFYEYDGSFVLYDIGKEHYTIYNQANSTQRVSPNSTYKMYLALMALESGIITTDQSTLKWNKKQYPFVSWNKDHNLSTAMKDSVTWYFEELDQNMTSETIQAYIEKMNYGNKNLSNRDDYWLESSLKISPVEQVQLLVAFYQNQFGFEERNIQAIKDSLFLDEYGGAKLYGKTGTGIVNGKSMNGWFTGYVEVNDNTFFFATNIQNEDNSYGSEAANITLSILTDKGIMNEVGG